MTTIVVSSVQNGAKHKLEMFAINCTTVRSNIILILPRILKKQTKVQLLICRNVYDEVIYFEVYRFVKNT